MARKEKHMTMFTTQGQSVNTPGNMLIAFMIWPVLFAPIISIKYRLENLVFQLPLYLVGVGWLKKRSVGKNKVFQIADHDFSNLSLIPIAILINHISEGVEDSWYQGEPKLLLKITAISPSAASRNAREVADALIAKYGSIEQIPPALICILTEVPKIARHLSVSRLQ